MRHTILNKILIVILIGVIPILWSNKTLDPNITIQYIGLAFLLLFYGLVTKNSHIKIDLYFSPLFFLFIIYSIIPLAISVNTADAIFRLSQFIVFFYLTQIFFQFKKPDILFNTLARITLVVSILILIPAFFQLLVLISEQNLTIPQSTYNIKSIFPHRNLFSHFLLLILPFCIYLYYVDKKIWSYAALASSSLALFLIIVLSNRTSWLCLILLLITYLTVYYIKKKVLAPQRKSGWIYMIAVVLVLGFAFLFQLKFSDTSSIKSHALNTLDYNQGSTKDRLGLWKRTVSLVQEKPFFGHGLGSWKINMLKYGNEGLVSENNITFYQRPHNDFLWIAAEQGIIGLLLYIGALSIILFLIIKTIRACDSKILLYQLIVYLSVLISFLILSIFSFPRERISHNIILFSSVGMFLNLQSITIGSKHNRIVPYKRLKYVSILVLAVILVIGIMRYQGELHTKNATIARKNREYRKCITEIEKAQSFVYQIDETSTPLVWQSGLSYFNMKDYNKANLFFKEALEINPFHIYALNDYAGNLAKLNKYDEAIKNYTKALNISPNFLDARLNLIALYYKQENFYSAFEALKKVDLTIDDERLKRTNILVIRKLLEYELSKEQPNIEFIHLYKKEYNNLSFYKAILNYAVKSNCDIHTIINNPNNLKHIN